MTDLSTGIFPALFASPPEALPVLAPPAIMADLLDPSTGEFLSLTQGADPTDAAVLVSLRTVRASGVSVMETGQQFGQARMIAPSLQRYMIEETEFALKHLTDARQISLDQVTVNTGDDWAELVIVYTNQAARVPRTLQLPLSASIRRAA